MLQYYRTEVYRTYGIGWSRWEEIIQYYKTANMFESYYLVGVNSPTT